MRNVKFLIIALMLMPLFSSCNKADSATLTFERTALYFSKWGDKAQSIRYVATNATSVAVSTCSEGWSAFIDKSTRTLTVSPVGATSEGLTNDDLLKEGTVVVNALNKEGQHTSYEISVYITSASQVLDENGRANCYVVTKPSANYYFDVMHRPDGEDLATASIKLLWQSNTGVVKNVNLVDNQASFYVRSTDEDSNKFENTNAVIAAYDKAGEIIWSWHLWIVEENPLSNFDTYANGAIFMRQNLGAFTNSNGANEEQKILDSYGMYYQWGRKDPFPRPYFFDASSADDESRYNHKGTYITETRVERSAKNGTIAYVTNNPMNFITNASCIEEGGDGIGDWLISADNNLWNDTTKSVYDPCPFGWKVPSVQDLLCLQLPDTEDNKTVDEVRGQYGWYLSDGTSTYFWSACGRRRYTDGKVENINYYTKEEYNPSLDYDPQPQPWAGYYWTSTTDGKGRAFSMHFDLRTTRSTNKFDTKHLAHKANGFQIRCIKE